MNPLFMRFLGFRVRVQVSSSLLAENPENTKVSGIFYAFMTNILQPLVSA